MQTARIFRKNLNVLEKILFNFQFRFVWTITFAYSRSNL